MDANTLSLVGKLAALISLVATSLYIRSTLSGQTRPNRATWWILTVVGFMIAASYYSVGARNTMWLAVTYVAGPFIVACLSIRSGEGGWTRFDRMCLFGAIVSVGVWWYSHSPLIALLMNLFIDFLGILPTIRKSYSRPQTEDRLAWLLAFVASGMSLFAVEKWVFAIVVYPAYMTITTGLITGLLFQRRQVSFTVL